MIKKTLILMELLIVLLLAGCDEKQEEKKEPLTILTSSINYEKFTEALQLRYPEIELEFISYKGYNQTGYIRVCLEDGELPDIVTTTYFVDEALQKDRLLDLSKYSFVNNYSDSWLNRCNVEGSIYLLPSNYSAIGIYYNRTILEKYGWELPENFQELKALAVKIREAGLTPCVARMDLEGFIFGDFFGLGNTFFFNTKEGEQWKKDFLMGKTNATGNIEPVLEYLNQWIEEGFISEKDIYNGETSDKFYEGEAVFMLANGIGIMEQDLEGIGRMEYGIMPWLSPKEESKMIVSSVSRYYGLNKELEKPENKEKLQDALHVMEFMASDEGMCLLKADNTTISPLNTSRIDPNNLYYEIKDYIMGGNTVPLVYVGWDDILIPMAKELYSLVRKEQTIEQCAAAFDRIRDDWLLHGPQSYGDVESYISKEDTAKIVGRALMEKKGADAALISLGEYHGFGMENSYGIQCGIYPGVLTLDRLRTVVPAGRMCLISLTGKEIQARKEEGARIQFSHLKEGQENKPFPYILVMREGLSLEEDKSYKVVIAGSELSEKEREEIIESWVPADSQRFMEEYFLSDPQPISIGYR